MVDITIVNGFINQLITGGHHPVCFGTQPLDVTGDRFGDPVGDPW